MANILGATMALIHFDEIAFLNYNWIVVPTAMNSMIAASENARKAGLPSPVIYTTTAGDPSRREGAYALSILSDSCPFSESLYDCKDRDDLVATIKKVSPNCRLYLEFSYKQLGKTDEWFEETAARSNASPDAIKRDLLNCWCSSSDNSVIPENLVQRILEGKREPSWTDLGDEFITRWYLDRTIVEDPSFRNRCLIVGMDTSENIGRDYTTITMIDPTDMSVVAVSRGNMSNIMAVARYMVRMLTMYPNLVWIPERNHMGVAILDFAIEELCNKGINPYTRIYNEAVQHLGDGTIKDANINSYVDISGRQRAHFGFRTAGGAASSNSSRNMLYKQTLMKTLELNAERIYDSTLITEITSLQERNGRIDHPVDMHDDTVISYLLACFLLFFGKNLYRYNIKEDRILTNVHSEKSKGTTTQEREAQIYMFRRAKELENLISNTDNPMMKNCYIRELKLIKPMVDESLLRSDPVSITQVTVEERQIYGHQNVANDLRRFSLYK